MPLRPRPSKLGGMRSLLSVVVACCAAALPARADDAAATRADPIAWVEHRPPGTHPVLGPLTAPVTIDFYANLGDGAYTPTVHYLLTELAERHPTRLRIVYRLVNRGPRSSGHLAFGREAFAQGRFFAFLDAFYGSRRRSPRASEFDEIAAEAGMDVSRLGQALADPRHHELIVATHHERLRRGVTRVPGLLINGVPVDEPVRSVDQLEALYDRAYARARRLLDAGVPERALYPRLVAEAAAGAGRRDVTPGAVDGLEPGETLPAPHMPLRLGALRKAELRRGADAPEVVLHFFCNLQSRPCRETARALRSVEDAYADAVAVVFHPVHDAEMGDQSAAPLLAEAALCAAEQAGFWDYYDHMHTHGRSRDVNAEYLIRVAEALTLDTAAFEGCLESGRQGAALERLVSAAHLAGVRHTPTVVVGTEATVGALDFEDLRTLVERSRAPGLLGRLLALPRPQLGTRNR